MADDYITKEQFESFMTEMRRSNAAVERMARSTEQNSQKAKAGGDRRTGNRDDARLRLERDMTRNRAVQSQNQNEQRSLQKSYRGFIGGIEKTGGSIALLGAGADKAGSALTRFAGAFGMGGIVGGMVAGATNLINTYRDMAEIGQTFQGSMFAMGRAAADAGMPLSDFARMATKSSKAMAFFGSDTIGRVTKQVRQLSERSGMFGYTMEGLNDVTVAYMEQQRIFGNHRRISEATATANSMELAKNISGLSAAFGTSREQILETTKAAMSSSSMIGRAMTLTGEQLQSFTKMSSASIAALAAIPGESGQMLSTFMADTIGQQQSIYARGADTFIQVGMSGILGAANTLQRNLEMAGDDTDKATDLTLEFTDTLRAEIERNLPVLRMLAAQGDAAANEMLQMHGALGKMNRDEVRATIEQNAAKKSLTAGLLSLGNVFNRISGSIMKGIFEVFGQFDTDNPGKGFEEAMKKFEIAAEKVGTTLGLFAKNLKPEEVEKFISSFGKGMKTLGEGAIVLAGMFTKVVGAIKWLHDFLGGNIWATIGATAAGIIGAKLAFSLGKDFLSKWLGKTFAQNVNIAAANVIVNGGVGGLGGRGGGRGRGRGGPRGGARPSSPNKPKKLRGAARRRAAMQAAAAGGGAKLRTVSSGTQSFGMISGASNQVSRVGQNAAKATGNAGRMIASGTRNASRSITRTAGKQGLLRGTGRVAGRVAGRAGGILGKKIPGVGLGVAGGLAAMRMAQGDQRGAAMEGLSGAMGTVPVVGTIGSLLMDGAIMGRDMIGRDRFDKFTNGVAKHINPMTLAAAIPGGLPLAAAGQFMRPRDPARAEETKVIERTTRITPARTDERKERRLEEETRQHQIKMESMIEALVSSSNQTRENTKRSTTSLRKIADVADSPIKRT